MKHELGLIAFSFLCLPSLGCSAEATPEGSGETCSAMLTANPENNYTFRSTLTFPPISVQPNAELTFDWSAVTTDFLGRELDPLAGVDAVHLMLWNFTQEELESRINADDVDQRDMAVMSNFYTGKMATSANVFEFTSLGMELQACDIWPFLQAPNPDIAGAHPECDDPNTAENDWVINAGAGYDPATHTYTVMVATGTKTGAGTKMIQAFKLDPASTNTHVAVTPSSTELEYTVDLESLTPARVPAGDPSISIEWKDLTLNAQGNPFRPFDVTEALVAHYSQSVSELEAQFLDLDLIHTNRWRGTIEVGTSVSLSSLTNDNPDGPPFTGIDDTGTWVVALVCGVCRNPAPWYLSILTPCTP